MVRRSLLSSFARFTRHPGFMVGAVLIGTLAVVAVAAPWIAPADPLAGDLSERLSQPNSMHWLGTDRFGRDVLSRLVWGARISLQVAIAVVAFSMLAGSLIGVTAGYLGGWTDRVLSFVNDILLAFPAFLLAIAFVAVRESTLGNVILAVGIAYTPRVAIVVRSVVLAVKKRAFIEATEAIGASRLRIVAKHVVPNSLSPVLVIATVSAATAILAEAGLSFLGIGVQPPMPTWGNVISEGRGFLRSNPWISVSAGLTIALAVIGLNLLGDGLRDGMDPHLRDASRKMVLTR